MFDLKKIENSYVNVAEPEWHEATSGEAISVGEALVLAAGKYTKCGATAVPTHIAMAEMPLTQLTNRDIPACRIQGNMIFRVPVMAAPTALNVGDKVTIHTDGLQVTATTSSGVVTIVDKNGATAAGDLIDVRI